MLQPGVQVYVAFNYKYIVYNHTGHPFDAFIRCDHMVQLRFVSSVQ